MINGRFDAEVAMINTQAIEISDRIDRCYTKSETNQAVSSAQKVFITPMVPTADFPVGMYYVGTEQPYQSYLVDSDGVVTDMGSADLDLTGYQPKQDDDLETNSKIVVEAINEVKSQIDSQNFPVGMIVPYTGADAPEGWLLCDGTQYPWYQNNATTKYYNLYNILKYTYGGTGEYFSVPDMRGRFLEGASSTSGHTLGKTVAAGIPDHKHTFTGEKDQKDEAAGSHNHLSGTRRNFDGASGYYGSSDNVSSVWYTVDRWNNGSQSKSYAAYDNDYTSSAGNHQHYYTPQGTINNASVQNSIYGAATTVQPKSSCVNYIIKY